jgi:flagellar biosynthetic protein FliQ
MTLTFIPKILAVGATLIITLPWMMQRMVDFTRQLLMSIPALVG